MTAREARECLVDGEGTRRAPVVARALLAGLLGSPVEPDRPRGRWGSS